MEAVTETVTILPDREEIAHVVDVCLSYVDFHEAARKNPAATRLNVKCLRAGICIPDTIARAFLAIVPLSQLEAAGLLNARKKPLPTVSELLAALRCGLTEAPEEFWLNPSLGLNSFEWVWGTYREFDWLPLEEAKIAVPAEIGGDLISALADFLWEFRHLGQPTTNAPSETVAVPVRSRSLFDRIVKKKKGRQTNRLVIRFGPRLERTLFYSCTARTNLRNDYDLLVAQAMKYEVDFDLAFEDFEAQVLAQYVSRKTGPKLKPRRRQANEE